MQWNLPQSSIHPLVKVTMTSPKGTEEAVLDCSHTQYEAPKGMDLGTTRVTAVLCDKNAVPASDEREVVLHEPQPKTEPKTEPKPKAKQKSKVKEDPTDQVAESLTDGPSE